MGAKGRQPLSQVKGTVRRAVGFPYPTPYEGNGCGGFPRSQGVPTSTPCGVWCVVETSNLPTGMLSMSNPNPQGHLWPQSEYNFVRLVMDHSWLRRSRKNPLCELPSTKTLVPTSSLSDFVW